MQNLIFHLKHARTYWLQDNHASAFALYEQLLLENPDNPLILREYARAIYAAYEDLEKATLLFEQAYKLEPTSVIVLLYLGELYATGYGSGYQAALSVFQRVITLRPQEKKYYVEAYLGIGRLYLAPGSPVSYDESINAFQKATEIDPQCPAAYENLGTALYSGGNIQAAQEALRMAEKLHMAKNQALRATYAQKLLERIKYSEPLETARFIGCSSTSEWPQGPIE
jgi:tetratricopeptide (TPR) repeat protein